jgi:hypothetical protein
MCVNLLCIQSGVFTSCEIRTLVEDGESSEFKALTAAFKNSAEVSDCLVLDHSSTVEYQVLPCVSSQGVTCSDFVTRGQQLM